MRKRTAVNNDDRSKRYKRGEKVEAFRHEGGFTVGTLISRFSGLFRRQRASSLEQIDDLERMVEDVSQRCASGDAVEDLVNRAEELCCSIQHCEKIWRMSAMIYLQANCFAKLESAIARAGDIFKADLESDCEQNCWWLWMRMEAAWWNVRTPFSETLARVLELRSAVQQLPEHELETTPKTENLTAEQLSAIVRSFEDIEQLKTRAREAICHKRYEDAYSIYTEAIAVCGRNCSPASLLAVLFCNRGAALHGHGNYLEAQADVCTALSLNPSYVKAYRRLIQLHLETRNAPAAAETLEGMRKCQLDQSFQELESLQQLEVESSSADKQCKIDSYKMLGLKRSCETAEVKKVFKSLALKLHPDKAAHSIKLRLSWMSGTNAFVDRCEKEIRDRIREHAQHLFKDLNAANDVLTKAEQRRDLDEELQAAECTANNQSWDSYHRQPSRHSWSYKSAPGKFGCGDFY